MCERKLLPYGNDPAVLQWKYYSGVHAKRWLPFFIIFAYLCVLPATEEMALWELIAAIRLLIQLIAALGYSFSLCAPQRSLSRDEKQFLFRRQKNLQSITRDVISFLFVGSKDIKEIAGSIIYSIFRKDINFANCSIISWSEILVLKRKCSYRITE